MAFLQFVLGDVIKVTHLYGDMVVVQKDKKTGVHAKKMAGLTSMANVALRVNHFGQIPTKRINVFVRPREKHGRNVLGIHVKIMPV